MKRCKVTFQPSGREIYVPSGTTVQDAIYLAGLDFDFPCGGRGKCMKCRVRIAGAAALPTRLEQEHLDAEEIGKGIRLACRTEIQNDIVVEFPCSETPEHQILVATDGKDVRLDPHLQKTYVEATPPSLADQRSDWALLKAGLVEEGLEVQDYPVSLSLLRELPQKLRQARFHVTAVTDGQEVLSIEKLDTTKTMLGIAFDIGTTTVVGYLMDLNSGKDLSVVSALNPQTQYGADVVSRITFVAQQPDGLDKLHDAIIGALNTLIGEAVDRAKTSREHVYAVTVVGNSCMHHLFLGINPTNLALAPYVPVTCAPVILEAQALGLQINPAGRVYVLPNIAGFVGADTVGMILATELDWSQSIKLAIDIGTNGEIVLGSRERLLACSAAAGPAFEGAQISSGMRGTTGAIDHIQFEENIRHSTIGDAKPQGICGSGLLDAVAGMLKYGIVDYRGKILSPGELTNPDASRFKHHIIEEENTNAFVLAAETETAHGRSILITQRDIRELQLAKGAIATGIQVLLEELGIGLKDVDEVLLAGAFGNYIDPHSASTIGLIPSVLEARVRLVGNAAGAGAQAALLSRREYRRAAQIAGFVEYIELGACKNFTSLFTHCLYFPDLQKAADSPR